MRFNAILTPKPGNQLWGIYYTDREYAREQGDPIRTVIEAPTKCGDRDLTRNEKGVAVVWTR